MIKQLQVVADLSRAGTKWRGCLYVTMAAVPTGTPQINDSVGLKGKSNSAAKFNEYFSAFLWRAIQFNELRA